MCTNALYESMVSLEFGVQVFHASICTSPLCWSTVQDRAIKEAVKLIREQQAEKPGTDGQEQPSTSASTEEDKHTMQTRS